MGLFDDDELEELIRQANQFHPMELNEINVEATFHRCLVTKDDPADGIQASVLFQQDLGYEKDSKPVFFSKSRLEQNKKNILYLLGQLKSVHEGNLRISSTESIYRYDGVKWTGDTVKLMELYHLGEATGSMDPFVKAFNTSTIRPALVKPTLSPKDPSFPAWWEAHKAEWEK